MTFLPRRVWLLACTTTLFAGGVLGVACGNGDNKFDGGGPDSGGDTTIGNDSGKDATGNDGGGNDGSTQTCEAGIGGSCDIVAQNCGAGKECALTKLADGGYTLQCQNNSTGSIKEGFACDPNAGAKCVAGLECIFNRCAKHCCSGDNQACGTAQPEGFTGKCDLNITLPNSNTVIYDVCTYNKPCEPFQIQACGPGLTCLVGDSNGTSNCYAYTNGGDAGSPEKTTCNSANECNDGLGCYSLDGGSSSCMYNCYIPPGPFDAGIATAPAGKGGCPTGETCKYTVTGLPSWFGICAK